MRPAQILNRNIRAVTGFFEEVPVLMIVIISMLIFFASVHSAYNKVQRAQRELDFYNSGLNFAKSVCAYPGLTYQGREGVFECYKVLTLSAANITRDLNPGYNYRVQIVDKSEYFTKYHADISSSPKLNATALLEGAQIFTLPITIFVSEEELHVGLLITTIWR